MKWIKLDLNRWCRRHNKTLPWLADAIGVSERTLRRWIARGAVPDHIAELALPGVQNERADLTRAQRLDLERAEWLAELDAMGPLAPTRELAAHLWRCPWPWPTEAVLLVKLVLARASSHSPARRRVEAALHFLTGSHRPGRWDHLADLWPASPLPAGLAPAGSVAAIDHLGETLGALARAQLR